MGFGLIIGFIERLQLETACTNDYKSFTDLHILQITTSTAYMKSSVCSFVVAR
jgi:hypothetical protein